MNKQEKIAVDPQIKKEINEEGFDENAAVLIGEKEEMPQLEEKLEKEGKAENLGTYIKMHKEIMLPKEQMSHELREKIKSGLYFYSGDVLMYVDKDGNIARVIIDSRKILSLNASPRGLQEQVEDELKRLGFLRAGQSMSVSLMEGDEILRKISEELGKYEIKIEEEIQEKKKEEFDF